MERKIDLNKIDAIIFDLGGVILNIDYQKTINAFEKLGYNSFNQTYSQKNQTDLFDQFEIGNIEADVFLDKLQSMLPKATKDQIQDAWNAMLLDLPINRLDYILHLKKHKKVFCYSNINAIHEARVSQIIYNTVQQFALDSYFDKVYYSHKIQMRKPNPEGFLYIIEEQQLQKQSTLFIDDSIQHIDAAKKLGLQTFFLQKGMEIDKDIF